MNSQGTNENKGEKGGTSVCRALPGLLCGSLFSCAAPSGLSPGAACTRGSRPGLLPAAPSELD